jgi:DNA-binding response OmpR family regulator
MDTRGSKPTPPARLAFWGIPAVEKRILVVDDDLHSREGLRDSLRAEGFKVETAADGWEAIGKVKEASFDIAIIDLDLPPVHGLSVSGWDLARIFRAYHPAISLIVVTAGEADVLRAEAEQMRVSQFLEKPISPARLKMIVKTLNS